MVNSYTELVQWITSLQTATCWDSVNTSILTHPGTMSATQRPGLIVTILFLQGVCTFATNPDIAITEFTVTSPDPVVYQQNTRIDIIFTVEISNVAATTGDLTVRSNYGNNFILKLYLTDNPQYEDSTSDTSQQTVMDRGVNQAIDAGQSIMLTGLRGQVKIPSENCGAYSYICIVPEIVDSSYTDSNVENDDKCVMFGLQDDEKAGEKQCQNYMDEVESRYGVVVTLEDIILADQWPPIVTSYRQAVANLVNTYCNINSHFGACCPGYGSKRSTLLADVVDADDVKIGRGFPVQSTNGENGRIMTYIMAKDNNTLCNLGSSSNSRKRRNIRNPSDSLRVRRASEDMFYLTQDALYGSINEHRDDLGNEIDYHVIGVSMTEHMGEDEFFIESWLIAVIVVCALISLTVIGAVIWLVLPQRNKDVQVYVYQ
ncbi:uncharacterized protein LOC100378416 [Saccoglossus kowalevskii]|uniref:Uncharacterized protein LOC100378416 n=1 Tax=Saccoglossus kowalevskii TaxID=10224 RepID=A0ABM0GM80_SACKO|nr:PREDICTED: uncharacterized protein LOC100378416 [Saccoglossus kowalevskii]